MPFNVGPMELIILLAIILIIFGAGRLPKVAEGMGKSIREFKKSVKDLDDDQPAPRET